MEPGQLALIEQTANIVNARIMSGEVGPSNVSALVRQVYTGLSAVSARFGGLISRPHVPVPQRPAAPEPATHDVPDEAPASRRRARAAVPAEPKKAQPRGRKARKADDDDTPVQVSFLFDDSDSGSFTEARRPANDIEPQPTETRSRKRASTVEDRGPRTYSAPKKKQRPEIDLSTSVQPDYIVCLEDGKYCKDLAKHLLMAYGMTPVQYREKHGLPREYPMMPPNIIRSRGELYRIDPDTGKRIA